MPNPTIPRKCHWLRRNRRSRRPELLIFVDAEADLTPIHPEADAHTLRLGWACLAKYVPYKGLDVIGWHEITDPVQFWDYVSRLAAEHKDTYVIGHNMAYDARVLHAFSIIPGIGWSPSYVILARSCFFVTFKADKNRLSLLDNMNLWDCSLADIGRSLGIPKIDIDLQIASDTEVSKYCRRDVEILVKAWDFWLELLDRENLGDFAITISSQAFNAFRHAHMHHKIGIHNNFEAIELERSSYKGGRCEVFRTGHFQLGPYYKLDVNGLYAYCMREFPTPRKLIKVISDVSPEYLGKLLDQYLVVADVILKTDEPLYAYTLKGYNVFPVGTFRATLTTWDLITALQHGHVVAIGPCALYEPAPLFREFIDHFTPLRQEYKAAGDLARSQLCKMLRNSLYGKFGQKGHRQAKVGEAPLDEVKVRRYIDAETGQTAEDWTFGGVTLRQTTEGEAFDSFPAIASHIAAAGRTVLNEYIRQAGPNNCYYADTDSLFVNQAGYDNLEVHLDPMELGCLKVEGVSPDLEIQAKKSYTFGDKQVHKGIRANAERTADGGWKQTHFTSIKWGFTHGNLDDVITYSVVKHDNTMMTHGKIGPNGQVYPPELQLDQDQISAIVQPIDPSRWDWWIDVPWLQSQYSRKRPPFLPLWFLTALSDAEVSQLAQLDDPWA